MATIKTIIDPEFKKGFSEKTQKNWVLMKVELSDGITATGFAPASVGDEVHVTKTDFGWQFRATKKASSGASGANDDVSKMLNLIYKELQEVRQVLGLDSKAIEDLPNDEK